MAKNSSALTRRHEFVLYFDVCNGNPNGDPDAGNMPRIDPETGHGLITDVCLKRKVRNYIEAFAESAHNRDPRRHRIYVTEGAILNEKNREAYISERPEDANMRKAARLTPHSDLEEQRLRRFMCDNFFDIRSFGAVLSTGINAGQVRGPVQFAFAQSIDPIMPIDVSITRMAVANDKKLVNQDVEGAEQKRGDRRTMGRKYIVPYGLYRVHGYVSAAFASHPIKGTGFSDDDFDLLLEAQKAMFDHDRSAARGEMAARKLVVFRHSSVIGNAPASELFHRVKTSRMYGGERHDIGDEKISHAPPARSYSDYHITIDRVDLPKGVEVIEVL